MAARVATVHDFVADVEAVRAYCQVEQAMIVGHSMGSAIALQRPDVLVARA